MQNKVEKFFVVTEQQKTQIDEFKEITGMTLSAIVEKSLISFLSDNDSNKLIKRDSARNKNYNGELYNKRQKVFLKKEVVTLVENYAKENNCNYTDVIISAISYIFEKQKE